MATDPDLSEWDYGHYEGLTPAGILAIRPGWNLFRDGCPGGESTADVSARVDRLIARVRRLEGNTALFTHGHLGRAFAARWIGLEIGYARHFLVGTASLGILGYEHERRDEPAIALWNSHA